MLTPPTLRTHRPGIRWASVIGNHDDEADLSREEIVQLDSSSSELSLTRQAGDDLTGVGRGVPSPAVEEEECPLE